jgi:hypothetical protein
MAGWYSARQARLVFNIQIFLTRCLHARAPRARDHRRCGFATVFIADRRRANRTIIRQKKGRLGWQTGYDGADCRLQKGRSRLWQRQLAEAAIQPDFTGSALAGG